MLWHKKQYLRSNFFYRIYKRTLIFAWIAFQI